MFASANPILVIITLILVAVALYLTIKAYRR